MRKNILNNIGKYIILKILTCFSKSVCKFSLNLVSPLSLMLYREEFPRRTVASNLAFPRIAEKYILNCYKISLKKSILNSIRFCEAIFTVTILFFPRNLYLCNV